MSLRVTGARTMPPSVFTKMLYPSFGALSMEVAARLPVAPPLLIGAIGVFSTFDISSAKILPVTSAKPPAGNATTISIAREGYFSCDQDSLVVEQRATTGRKARAVRILVRVRVIFSSSFDQKPNVPLGSLILSHSSNIA